MGRFSIPIKRVRRISVSNHVVKPCRKGAGAVGAEVEEREREREANFPNGIFCDCLIERPPPPPPSPNPEARAGIGEEGTLARPRPSRASL